MDGMKKYKLNFLIDALMFLLTLALAGIGFLLAYVIVPGREAAAKYGPGVEPWLFGLDRHAWGDIHLVLGFVLLGLLIAHLALHLRIIQSMFSRLFPTVVPRRVAAGAFAGLGLFLLLFFALFEPELHLFQRGAGRGLQSTRPTDPGALAGSGVAGHRTESRPAKSDTAEPLPEKAGQSSPHGTVRGMYTLGSVAREHGVPVSYIVQRLGLPQDISPGSRLGRLRRQYGFSLEDVEKTLKDYRTQTQ